MSLLYWSDFWGSLHSVDRLAEIIEEEEKTSNDTEKHREDAEEMKLTRSCIQVTPDTIAKKEIGAFNQPCKQKENEHI